DRSDHAGVGQRPLSTQRRGQGIGQSVGYHAVVPPLVLAQPEPDRTLVEVHQTSCPLRPLPSEVRRLSSRHPRNPRRHSDHVRRATGDADDAQLSAIRRCFAHGRVRYSNFSFSELAQTSPNVLQGATRTREFWALQEAFFELKLADLGPDYDFVSVRAGTQPFISDFRGFLFSDFNRAIRLFGTRFSNRDQFNLAYFRQWE